jgi:hypothetical protein
VDYPVRGSGHADVAASAGIPEADSVSLVRVGLLCRSMDMGMFQDGDSLSLRRSNQNPPADGGRTLRLESSSQWPAAADLRG